MPIIRDRLNSHPSLPTIFLGGIFILILIVCLLAFDDNLWAIYYAFITAMFFRMLVKPIINGQKYPFEMSLLMMDWNVVEFSGIHLEATREITFRIAPDTQIIVVLLEPNEEIIDVDGWIVNKYEQTWEGNENKLLIELIDIDRRLELEKEFVPRLTILSERKQTENNIRGQCVELFVNCKVDCVNATLIFENISSVNGSLVRYFPDSTIRSYLKAQLAKENVPLISYTDSANSVMKWRRYDFKIGESCKTCWSR